MPIINALKDEKAYDHYNRLQYHLNKEQLALLFGPGKEYLEGHNFNSKIMTHYSAPLVRLSDGEKTGYVVRTRGRKLKDVARDAYEAMKDMVDESLGLFHYDDNLPDDGDWPEKVRWIAVFPVTGGSEGHYVHVELILDNGARGFGRALFMLGKTFQGMEHAKAMCSRLIDLFDC